AASVVLLAAIHLAALVLMFQFEAGIVPKAAFLATWAFLNFFWISLLQRAAPAAALSLAMVVLIFLLSTFKYSALNMTATAFEAIVIDQETFSFLLATFPELGWQLTMIAIGSVIVAALIWWLDPFQIRPAKALLGCLLAFAILGGLSFAVPLAHEELFV